MVAMPAPPQPRLMTPEEFLAWEYQQEGRYEYVEGKIIAMAGESPEHNQISGNMYLKIGNAIERPRCKVYFAEIRVRVAETRYRYPDIMALCGTPQFADTRPKTLLNPQIVIEVLSGSTQHIDREDKLQEYLALDSVTDYCIAAQNRTRILHYHRRGPEEWNIRLYSKPEDTIILEAIGVTLTLADIYRDLVFAAPEPETDEAET